jgi:hypothetical protein
LRFPDAPGGEARIVRDALGSEGAAFRAGPWSGPQPPGGWSEALSVFASDDPAAPPMLGAYEQDGDAVVFRPRFAPSPQLRLRAVFRPPDGPSVTAWFGGVPAPERAPTTRVVSVTPSADIWPENLLRLYLSFSAPMRIGEAWRHIRMLDAGGAAMGGMFVEIDQELWDPQGRRLTVLFDPGRIKRGLVDNINEGPPLVVGRRCVLEIDAGWRDAHGSRLAEPFRHEITVGPPLRDALDPAAWRLTPPTALDQPLTIDFPRPLDAALALRSFAVRRGQAEIDCDVSLERGETRLALAPTHGWRAGRYRLVADAVLEDVAGNRIGRPFDIDTRADHRREAEGAEVWFEV